MLLMIQSPQAYSSVHPRDGSNGRSAELVITAQFRHKLERPRLKFGRGVEKPEKACTQLQILKMSRGK